MPYIITVSSLLFTFQLIRVTLQNNPHRFTYKVIACVHFLLLGMTATLFVPVAKSEIGLLYGLFFSFVGDIFLGLRSKRKIHFNCGLFFFILAQFAYLSVFAFSSFNVLVFAITMLIQSMVIAALIRYRGLDLPVNIVPFVLLYDFILISVFTLAFGSYFQEPSLIHFLRLSGALFFLLSDSILFTVYFIRPKSKVQILLYMAFYHLAQLLYAFTLWL